MGTPLRVLIVEDSEEDTLLIVRELKRGGFDPIHERVETAESMKAALSTKTWDLILADYSMPHFSGLKALKLFKESGLDLPFIIVSGSIGEDIAIEAMKSGAHDYLMKNNLTRLVPSIQQELRESEVRRKLKVSQNALQESEKRYRQVVENATEIIYTVDDKGNFTYGNPAGLKVTGYSLAELRSFNYADLVLPEHRERVMEIYINQFRQRIPTTHVEFPFFNKAGKIIWFSQNSSLVIEDGKVMGFHIIARDITERKQAEERLQEREHYFRTLMYTLHEDIVVIDCDYRITDVNNTFLITTGSSREKVIGKHCYEISHGYAEPCDRHGEQCLLGEVFGTGESRNCKHVHMRGDGSKVHVDILLSPLMDDSGSVTHVVEAIRDVTDLIQAYEALRESEEKYRLLVENANEAIFVIQDGMIRFFNIKNIELIGYSKEELTSTPFINFVHPDDREVTIGRYLKRIRGEELPGVNVFRIIDKAGNIRWAEVNSVLISWEGRPATLNFLNDITERKKAEQALSESEQRYRNLVENAPDVIYTLAYDGTITSLNPAFEKITGWPRPEWLDKQFAPILHPDDLSRGLEFLQRALKGEKIAPFELRVLGKSGDYLTAEFTVTPQTQNGSVIGILGLARDITERRRIEEILQMTQFSVEHAPESVLWINSKGQLDYANEAACRALGYSREELVSTFLWDIDPDFNRERWSTHWQGLPKRGPSTRESHHCTKEGKIFPVEITGDYLKYGDKEYNVAFIRDITERKQTEEALRSSEEKYRSILENIEDGYFEVDIAGNLTFFNDSLCQIYGYSRNEMMDMNDRQYTDQENAKKLFQAFNKVYRTGESTKEFDWEIIRKDGARRRIEASVSLIKDSSGNRIGFRGLVRDVTERKQIEQEKANLEEQLRQSQKIEAIGRLAGGIAHDFNNLLTVIKGYSQLSLIELKEDVPLRGNIEEIKKASEKAADLTRQLLAFSRRQILEMRVLDLNTVLRDMDKMLHRLIGEDIELVTVFTDDLGRVKTDPGWVEQIIMNLAVNARDAMLNGGKLTIETANVELDETYARGHIAVKPGRYVMLSMSDTGVGMTPEVKQQVFEPFFTTKEKGKGTGLGLSTVYGIVKQSGGNIWVYSEPGKGTTFKIYLPCVDEPLEKLGERVEVKEVPCGTETILIVEDEEEVLKLVGRILSRQGYKVLEASQGLDAFLIAEKYEDLIHLLVTDVVMPKISGRELADRIAEIRPEIKVLYMSGYTDNAIVHHGVLGEGMKFIQKPFTVDGLARKVREVLDKA